MPLVRIDVPMGRSPEKRRIIADVIYDAMIATLNVPQNDRFQIISEHESHDLIIDPTYLGIERTPCGDHHSSHAERGAFSRSETVVLQSRRRGPSRSGRNASGGRFHQLG